jgi:hypothetical protein
MSFHVRAPRIFACALVAALVAGGCVTITAPTSSAPVAGPTVTANVSFRTPMCTSFAASLDGANVTASFSGAGYGAGSAVGTLTAVPPGSHTLSVTADTQQFWFLIPYCGSTTDSVTFTVSGTAPMPALGFAPAGPLNITTGTLATVKVTSTPAPGSALSVTVTAAPANVVSIQGSPATIAAGSTSSAGNLTLQGQAAGSAQVTASVLGATSGTLTVNVTVAPSFVLFRSTNTQVEMLRFTPGTPFGNGTFQLLQVVPAAAAPGMLSVGLCRSGARLGRASSQAGELFTIGGTATAPTLTLTGHSPPAASLNGVGTGCAFVPGALARATDTGVETLDPAVDPMTRLAGRSSGLSSLGVAALSDGTRLFRSHSTGLEAWDLSTPSTLPAPVNVITNMSSSATGTALAWLQAGATLVRATSVGLDVVSVSGAAPTRLGFNNTGGGSAVGVAVDVAGTRAARGTGVGMEVWSLATPSAPALCARGSGGGSGTGVGVVVRGSVAFRATDTGIEAWDISGTTCPATPATLPAPIVFQTGLGTSATGVALVGQ